MTKRQDTNKSIKSITVFSPERNIYSYIHLRYIKSHDALNSSVLPVYTPEAAKKNKNEIKKKIIKPHAIHLTNLPNNSCSGSAPQRVD